MGDELTHDYWGTTTVRIRDGRLIQDVSGIGSLYTDLDTGSRRAIVNVPTPDGATTFRFEAPDLFEQRYL